MKWLDSSGLVLPPVLIFPCPFNILFNFKILIQVTHLALEFYLSFKNLREYQLIDSFSLLAEFLCLFCTAFSYWLKNILVAAFEKGDGQSIGI